MPLVRYYWEASFCHRQFRGFRASLVFTKPFPQAPPSNRTIFVTFSHFRVKSFTPLSHNDSTPEFSRNSRETDQWSVPGARINCRRRASGASLPEHIGLTPVSLPAKKPVLVTVTHRHHHCQQKQSYVLVLIFANLNDIFNSK